MRRSKRQTEERISRLLAGEGDSTEEPLARFVDQLRSDSTAPGSTGSDLISRMAEETQKAAESAPGFTYKSPVRTLPPRWRRRIMLSTFLSSLAGKLLVGSVALAATGGGLAASGNLPDPLQAAAQDALAQINIEIPGPDVEADDTAEGVLGVVEEGDPQGGVDFGKAVGDEASDGESEEGTDTATDAVGDGEGAADDYSDIEGADDVDEAEVPEEADSDDYPDDATDNDPTGSAVTP